MNKLLFALAATLIPLLLVVRGRRRPPGSPSPQARQLARHIAAQAIATAAAGGAGAEEYRLDDRWPHPAAS